MRKIFGRVLVALGLVSAVPGGAAQAPFCGDRGVWIQILGSSGVELETDRAAASYLLWLDGQARLLVDPGPGSAFHFARAKANFADLEAVVFSRLRADQTADFASFAAGSEGAGRNHPLPVLGPDGNDLYPSTQEFVERIISSNGVYPYLADFQTFRGSGGYKISPRNVPAAGRRRWARFGSSSLGLAAIPVHHGDVPSLAWRAEIGGFVVVFAGSFNNEKNVITSFAKDADALIAHMAILETTRGDLREWYAAPSQIGRIARLADVRMLILGNRTARTLGRESQSRVAIEEHFDGPLIFANELECWGL